MEVLVFSDWHFRSWENPHSQLAQRRPGATDQTSPATKGPLALGHKARGRLGLAGLHAGG